MFFSAVMAYGNQPDSRPLDLLGYALLAATVLGLGWVPRRPGLALAVSAGAAAGVFTLGYAISLWALPPLVALFSAISAGRRRAGWAGAAFLVLVPAVAAVVTWRGDVAIAVVVWALLVLVVAQPAEVSRARRAYTEEVERRAAEAERTREEEALRRAQEERLRVARELHDVTSHTVSVIALHAAVAAEAVERAGGPPEAAAALQIIRTSSRQALAEMKSVLSILRPTTPASSLPGHPEPPAAAGGAGLSGSVGGAEGAVEAGHAELSAAVGGAGLSGSFGGAEGAAVAGHPEASAVVARVEGRVPAGGARGPARADRARDPDHRGVAAEPGRCGGARGAEPAGGAGSPDPDGRRHLTPAEPRHPLPGTAQLPALLRTTGLPVTLDVKGERRPLPPAADLTVYRVVQEALTNTIRHAEATTAAVTLTYEEGAVTVRVDDDGRGSLAPRGHGLTGMAERVAAVGGRLTTGNGPTGGFRVTARLPA